MNNTTKNTAAAPLAKGAVCVALATALAMLPFKLPQGGGVNGSMLPIVLYSFKEDKKWGLTVSLTYALLQLLTGFYPPPTHTITAFALTVLLDYMVAFGFLGLAGTLNRIFIKKIPAKTSMLFSVGICYFVRFLCSFISGIIIWQAYAIPGMPVWLYSLQYNGSYMLVEFAIAAALLISAPKSITNLQ